MKNVTLVESTTQSQPTAVYSVIVFLIIGNQASTTTSFIVCASELHTVSVTTSVGHWSHSHFKALAKSFNAHFVNPTFNDFLQVSSSSTVTPHSNSVLSYVNVDDSAPHIVTIEAS